MHVKAGQITKLQLQRDFLKQHAEQFPQELQHVKLPSAPPTIPGNLDESIDIYIEFLEQQIQV